MVIMQNCLASPLFEGPPTKCNIFTEFRDIAWPNIGKFRWFLGKRPVITSSGALQPRRTRVAARVCGNERVQTLSLPYAYGTLSFPHTLSHSLAATRVRRG